MKRSIDIPFEERNEKKNRKEEFEREKKIISDKKMEYFKSIVDTYPNSLVFWENLAAFNQLPTNQRLETISQFWEEIISNQKHVLAEYRWLPIYTDIYAFVTFDEIGKNYSHLVELLQIFGPNDLKTYIVGKLTYTFGELTNDLSKIENLEVQKLIVRYKKNYFLSDYWFEKYLRSNEELSKIYYEEEERIRLQHRIVIPYWETNEEKLKYQFFNTVYNVNEKNSAFKYQFAQNIEKHLKECPKIFKHLLINEPEKFAMFLREKNTRRVFIEICEKNPDIDSLFVKSIFNFDEPKLKINELLKKCAIMYKVSREIGMRDTNAKEVIQKKIDDWKFKTLDEFLVFFELLKSDVKYLNLNLNYESVTKQIFNLTDNPLFFVLDEKLFNIIYILSDITEEHVKKFIITSKDPFNFLFEITHLIQTKKHFPCECVQKSEQS